MGELETARFLAPRFEEDLETLPLLGEGELLKGDLGPRLWGDNDGELGLARRLEERFGDLPLICDGECLRGDSETRCLLDGGVRLRRDPEGERLVGYFRPPCLLGDWDRRKSECKSRDLGEIFLGERLSGDFCTGRLSWRGERFLDSLGERPLADKRSLGERPLAGKRSLGERPLAGKRSLGERPLAGKRSLGERPLAGTRSLGERPLAGKRSLGERPLAGTRSLGERPLARKRSLGERPLAGKRSLGERPLAGKRSLGERPLAGERAKRLNGDFRPSRNKRGDVWIFLL